MLTLSRRRPLSYINQSIGLRSKSMDWLLYDNGLRLDRVNDAAVKLNSANVFYLKSRILTYWNLVLAQTLVVKGC